MDFFRKVKKYVTGQVGDIKLCSCADLNDGSNIPHISGGPQTEAAQDASAGVSACPKVSQTRAAVTYRQPVLQNAGFGMAGGVQVSIVFSASFAA